MIEYANAHKAAVQLAEDLQIVYANATNVAVEELILPMIDEAVRLAGVLRRLEAGCKEPE